MLRTIFWNQWFYTYFTDTEVEAEDLLMSDQTQIQICIFFFPGFVFMTTLEVHEQGRMDLEIIVQFVFSSSTFSS